MTGCVAALNEGFSPAVIITVPHHKLGRQALMEGENELMLCRVDVGSLFTLQMCWRRGRSMALISHGGLRQYTCTEWTA